MSRMTSHEHITGVFGLMHHMMHVWMIFMDGMVQPNCLYHMVHFR
jgi:hypothetical protein